MIHQVRVIFGDTDQMGVVYYANYLRFFESARAAYMRHIGYGGQDLIRWEIGLPVTEANCRYRMPAQYEDLLDIDIRVDPLRAASIGFRYLVHRGDDLIAEGTTMHACIGNDGRPRRLPEEFRQAVAALIEREG